MLEFTIFVDIATRVYVAEVLMKNIRFANHKMLNWSENDIYVLTCISMLC